MVKFFFVSLLTLFLITTWPPQASLANSDTTSPDSINTATNQTFQNIEIKEFVNLDSFEGNIPGYELACEQDSNGKIGFCAGECTDQVGDNRGARISRQCAEFFDQFITKCVEEIGCHNNTAFCGVGGHSKRDARNSSRPSRHSTGDALDLFGIRCKDKMGRDMNMDFSESARGNIITRKRYDDFANCWERQVEAYRSLHQIRSGGGAITCTSSPPRIADLHADHVHLSCPTARQNVITK